MTSADTTPTDAAPDDSSAVPAAAQEAGQSPEGATPPGPDVAQEPVPASSPDMTAAGAVIVTPEADGPPPSLLAATQGTDPASVAATSPDISAAGDSSSPPAPGLDTHLNAAPPPQATTSPVYSTGGVVGSIELPFTGSLTLTPDPNIPPAVPQSTVQSVVPNDPRMAQMHIRYNSSNHERMWNEERQAKGWLHSRPFSIYLAAIGNHWKPKSWAHVIDMVQYANEHGMYVVFEEIQDRCQEPYDALGVMRNEVLTKAEYGGFEFVGMVDNDILPREDTLFRMLRKMWLEHVTVCAPLVYEPGSGRPLHGPTADPYTGMKPVRWNVLSMILFKTSIFRSFAPGGFWHDPRGADEGFHYQKLHAAGHNPHIDTEVVVDVYQAPTYPLTVDKQANGKELWDSRKQAFGQVPDRRPLDANDPRVNEHGIYMPFWAVPCPKERGGCGNGVPGTWWRESPVCPGCQQRIAQTQGIALQGVAEGAPDGVYRRCKAVENGQQCFNQHPYAHGFCQMHVNRVGATA